MGTIRFAIRTDLVDSKGLSPIQLVYQMHQQRKRKSTGHKVNQNNWDQDKQEAIYVKKGSLSADDVKEINDKLTDMRRDIERIERRFEANEEAYTLEMVLQELENLNAPITKKDTSSKELFAFIDRYIKDHEYLRVHGSLSVYRSLKKHLQDYEKKDGKRVTFDKIDYAFFQGFQNFLVSLTKKDKDGKYVRALNNITIAKQLSTLKTFLNYAKAQGIEVSNKYEAFKIKRENELEVIALTRDELAALYKMDLSKKPAWAQVRDVFCFSCETGLRYSDIKQLRREHIKGDEIDLTTIKTSYKNRIPLSPNAIAILKKYKNDDRPLPVISNQRTNEHLQKICDWAGINNQEEIVRHYGNQRVSTFYPKWQLISFHCGRKTMATHRLEQGVPAEIVMRLGGWKDYKSFKRYMNITDDRIRTVMQQIWTGQAINPKLKAV